MSIETFFQIYLELSLKSFVVLAGALVANLALQRASAANRHMIWLAALATLLLMPFTKLINPHWVYVVRQADIEQPALPALPPIILDESAPDIAESTHPSNRSGEQLDLPSAYRWSDIAAIAWVTVAGFVLFRRAAASRRLRGLIARSRRVSKESLLRLAQSLAASQGVQAELCESEECRVPFVCGIWKPVVLLPVEASEWSEERLCSVLLHEFEHVRRRDCLTRLLMDLLCAVYWINPLIWIAAPKMRLVQEQACDDRVLSAGVSNTDYAHHLLQIVRNLSNDRFLAHHALAMAQPSTLETRVRAIVDTTRCRTRLTRSAVAVCTFAIAGALLLCGASQIKAAGAGISSQEGTAGSLKSNQSWALDDTHGHVRILKKGRHRSTDVSPSALRRLADVESSDVAIDSPSDLSAWVAVAHDGRVFLEYTSDSGEHWKEIVAAITADGVSISFLDERRGFLLATSSPAAGLMKKIAYATEDGGRTWRHLSSPNAASYYATGIAFRNPSNGWVTGTYHGGDAAPFYRTQNGGKSWILQKLPVPANFEGDYGYGNVYPPVFSGKNRMQGVMTVELVRHEPAPDHRARVTYITEDGGDSWRVRKIVPE